MKKVCSVSGGKTSAYMALHFPADYYVFALVLSDDPFTLPKDKGILKECEKRVPGFSGTREDEATLVNILKLEQELGKEIKWVFATTGANKKVPLDNDWSPKKVTLDDFISKAQSLPNRVSRFCTEEAKIYPIFWHTYLHIIEELGDVVLMDIGFRIDESHRAESEAMKCTAIKFPASCSTRGNRNRSWKKTEWRIPNFPLIENRIDHYEVLRFWREKNWKWPKTSNCDGCFWKSEKEISNQFRRYPDRMQWWVQKEKEIGARWKKDKSYEILSIGKQIDILELLEQEQEQGSCFCTD